ncbi:hypothetical protein, partial [Salmonella enterica]|uniref:hypothetical protein n=1 Tax=Salmonella enterica TaxID=28901 RepID=UPI0020C3A839
KNSEAGHDGMDGVKCRLARLDRTNLAGHKITTPPQFQIPIVRQRSQLVFLQAKLTQEQHSAHHQAWW